MIVFSALRYIQYLLLKHSMRRSGCMSPVLVSRDGTVLDGNRRVQAAKELGIPIPVVFVDADVQMVDPARLKISCPVKK